jgi:hypothetical protein
MKLTHGYQKKSILHFFSHENENAHTKQGIEQRSLVFCAVGCSRDPDPDPYSHPHPYPSGHDEHNYNTLNDFNDETCIKDALLTLKIFFVPNIAILDKRY